MDEDVFLVRCGSCDAGLRLPARPGLQGRCPHCRAALVVPTAEEVEAVKPELLVLMPPGSEPAADAQPAPPSEPARGKETREMLRDMLGRGKLGGKQPSLDDICGDGEVDFD